MADIFISFIHEEEPVASALQRFIKALLTSTEVFMSADTWQVYAGEIWLDRITQELKKAQVVLLLLSPRSVIRPWVNFEAGGAWFSGKKIIPISFNGLTKGALPKPYSNIQAVNLETTEDQYYLIKSITHHLPHVLTPPPPMPDLIRERHPAIAEAFEPYIRLSDAVAAFIAEEPK